MSQNKPVEPQASPVVDLDDPALIEALARLLYEAEKRRERTSRLRDLDR